MARKYQNTELRKEQITDATKKILIKYGNEHVTIKKIAQEVGISESAIYRHFNSKRDILFALAEQVENNLLSDISDSNIPGLTPLETLNLIFSTHLSTVQQTQGVSFQIIAEIISMGDKKLNRKISNTIDKYISSLTYIINNGIESKELREDIDAEATALIFFGTLQGLVTVWMSKNHNIDLQNKLDTVWDILCKAITVRQT